MRTFRGYFVFLSFLICLSCTSDDQYCIVIDNSAGNGGELAARELRRYLYQTTGDLPTLSVEAPDSKTGKGFKDRTIYLEVQADKLGPEEFVFNSQRAGLSISGGSDQALLYGVYHFAEAYLGVGFYLHGDVIPDRKMDEVNLEGIDETYKPLFQTRGILPFHDFPEGPDWWDLEAYKAILSQLPKMKMNFIGMHTYPQASRYPDAHYQAEPLVWIGKEEDINKDGTVERAYPVLHFQTGHDTWGYAPRKTSDYACGASLLFEEDDFGASYMTGISDWPHTEEENLEIFNEHGRIIDQAFTFAQSLGVKTCIGTEVPLTIPRELESPSGKTDEGLIQSYYEGMFERIKRTHPLDYFWLWTGEDWTWKEIPDEEVDRVSRDMVIAARALEHSGAAFQMATCGWVLGPERDRAEFDRLLSKEMPFSCINREVGWDYIEPAFSNLQGRPKWAIPWMEDDPALITTQLWAGRMRKDAVDALHYGCTGLIGIHWRTRNISPSVSSLAKAAWEMGDWKDIHIEFPERDLPVGDFYDDWCARQFGEEVAEEAASIFSKLDGGDFYDSKQPFIRKANLHRASTWISGPGGIIRNPASWDMIQGEFSFIEELEELDAFIVGKGNRERFTYWLNAFRFEESLAKLGCTLGALDSLANLITKDPAIRGAEHPLIKQALGIRAESVRLYEEAMGKLLAMVHTTGELGMVANMENHNRARLQLLTKQDELLGDRTGLNLRQEYPVSDSYKGPARIINPVCRGLLERGENLELRVLILSTMEPQKAVLKWRPFGKEDFIEEPLKHLGRGVYHVSLAADELDNQDFEYYLEAGFGEERIVYPAGAPELSQSVVIMPL